MNLSVHIERLVLNEAALGGGQPALLQAAIQNELARLLGQGALAPGLMQGAAVAHMAAPACQLAPGASAAQTGIQIAAAVYGGIGT